MMNKDNKKDMIIKKVRNFFHKFLNRKYLLIGVVFIIVLFVILYFIFFKKDNKKFALNEAYDVYPEEVRELYSNMVEVSCNGDLYVDIKADTGSVDINKINSDSLINYMFSYMDKNNLLNNSIDDGVIKNVEKKLFNDKINLFKQIKAFNYNDYEYNYNSGKITRKKSSCVKKDIKYVSHLYGYFTNGDNLFMDVNIGYLKDGVLYDLDDNKLGSYDEDISKLSNLMQKASYYRFNYVKDKDDFKLSKIELKHKS